MPSSPRPGRHLDRLGHSGRRLGLLRCLSKWPVFDLLIPGLPRGAAARIGGRRPAPKLGPRWVKPWSTLRTFPQQDPARKPPPLSDSEASVTVPGQPRPSRERPALILEPQGSNPEPARSGYGDSAVLSTWTPRGRACALRRLQAQTHEEPDRRLALVPPGLQEHPANVLSARDGGAPAARRARLPPHDKPSGAGGGDPRKTQGEKSPCSKGRGTAKCSGPSSART